MFTSALAPRSNGSSIVKPTAVGCPQPIEPTPGIKPTQFAARMKMKIVAKNQNVRRIRCGPMMPSRKRYRPSMSDSTQSCRPSGTGLMLRVALWLTAMRSSATIQVTTIELVTGNPNGRAISTAFCDSPCSSAAAAATVAPAPTIHAVTPHRLTLLLHLRITSPTLHRACHRPHPPSAMGRATRAIPTATIPNPARQPGLPAYRPSDHPVMKSITIAIAFDARRAVTTLRTTKNGITTGNVETKTSRNTPAAPAKSARFSDTSADGSGSVVSRSRIVSTSIGVSTVETAGGSASRRSRCAASRSRLWRMALSVTRPRARSVKFAMRNIAASTIPQARLQPIAAASTPRVFVPPPSATLIDPVNVRTMITPNRISHARSMGSSSRPEDRSTHLLSHHVRQLHHLGAVVLGHDGALVVEAQLRRRHELAMSGSWRHHFEDHEPEVEPGPGLRARRSRPDEHDRRTRHSGDQSSVADCPRVDVLDDRQLVPDLQCPDRRTGEQETSDALRAIL